MANHRVVEHADFFMRRCLMQWTDGNAWWRRFVKRRENWDKNQIALYGGSRPDTWQMVDHGWKHAQELYCLIPRFIWAVSHFLPKGMPLFQNAAEVYALMAAAYLHDIGMSLPTARLDELRRDLQAGDFPFATEELYAWMNERNAILIKGSAAYITKQEANNFRDLLLFSDAKAVRKLHPELGAWLCNSERILADPDERSTIAQIVFRHAKRISKTDVHGSFCLEIENGEPQSVRVGVIGFLIAFADACQMGHNRVQEVENHLHNIRSEIAKCNVFLKMLGQKPSRQDVRHIVEEELNLLRMQPEHMFKHRAVKYVSMGPNGFIAVPDIGEGNGPHRFAFEYTMLQEFGDIRTFGELVATACSELLEELSAVEKCSPDAHVDSLFEALRSITVPIIDASNWFSIWTRSAIENDRLWALHCEHHTSDIETLAIADMNYLPTIRQAASEVSKHSLGAINTATSQLSLVTTEELIERGWGIRRIVDELIAIDYETLKDAEQKDIGVAERWIPVVENNPEGMRIVINEKGEIVAYWHFLPLQDDVYREARSGRLDDGDVSVEDIATLALPGEYGLYFMIVSIRPAYRTILTRRMLLDAFTQTLYDLASLGVFFPEICALAFSQEGDALCRTLKMKYLTQHLSGKPIYALSLKECPSRLFYSGALMDLYTKRYPVSCLMGD